MTSFAPCCYSESTKMSAESLDSFLEAEKLLKLGRNDEAFHLFARFIQEESCSLPLGHKNELARAFNERGYIQYLRVDFQSAIEDYSEAIALDEDFAVAYYNRGLVQYRLGRYQLAREDLTRALELDPHFTDAQMNLQQIERDLSASHEFNSRDPLHTSSYSALAK